MPPAIRRRGVTLPGWVSVKAEARDMGMKGSHRVKVWGPCAWALELLGRPQTDATRDMLWRSGGSTRGPHGHEGSISDALKP